MLSSLALVEHQLPPAPLSEGAVVRYRIIRAGGGETSPKRERDGTRRDATGRGRAQEPHDDRPPRPAPPRPAPPRRAAIHRCAQSACRRPW